MSNFGKSNVNNFSLVEVLVLLLVIILVVFITKPKISKFAEKIKMDNAMDSVFSYKDEINKYYVSRLMYDYSFKLDGKYNILEGNLKNNSNTYNLSIAGNIPSEGYLNYNNNILVDGCIYINNYYFIIDNENVSISDYSCMNDSDVAYEGELVW